jgi:hypothetical protein
MSEAVVASNQSVKLLEPAGGGGGGPSPVPVGAAVAVVASFVAAWVAAGSVGLLGHPLRHALTWVTMGVAIIAAIPARRPLWGKAVSVLSGAGLVVLTTPSIIPAVNVMGIAAAVAVLAMFSIGASARALRVAAASLCLFAVYRLAMQAAPIVWSWADDLGRLMGTIAGRITRRDLSVGVTFGGVDFLVLGGAFYGMWLASSPAPRGRRALAGAAAILAAHLAYLVVLSLIPGFLSDVPMPTRDQPSPRWEIPLPFFVDAMLKLNAAAVRDVLPWNVPALAALLHGVVVWGMLRWGAWRAEVDAPPRPRAAFAPWFRRVAPVLPPALVALSIGVSSVFCTPARSLEGKKVVVYNRVFGNYMKPRHGDYGHLSIGMYGNLPHFVESLGGRCVVTNQLTDDHLRDADALFVIYPSHPYVGKDMLQEFDPLNPTPPVVPDLEQVLRFADRFLHGSIVDAIEELHVKRVWNYVDKGGSLLVMGEHTIADPHIPESMGRSHFNRLLAPSNIRVAFDSATFKVGGWLQSYHTMFHPTTAGIEDSRNQFGVVIGASLDITFPARPILIGKWGYNDPGDEASGAAMMGNHEYDAGERLGDVILAAEQGYGRGKVVVFGDTSSLTNGITVGAHPFNARLLAYLTHAGGTANSTWRQVITMLLGVALVVLLIRGALIGAAPLTALGLLASMICLAAAVSATTALVCSRAELYPTASNIRTAPPKIAYIDNAHLGYYSEESWRPEGTMGLAMNLMRNGYLTYMAPDLSRDRLMTPDGKLRTSLVVIPAPTRSLTQREIQTLYQWADAGGSLVMTVGWDRYGPNRELLHAFGFDIGSQSDPSRPPEPLGHYKAPYWRSDDGSYMVFVRFHAAWWVRLLHAAETKMGDTQGRYFAREMAYGRANDPTMLWRRIGKGQVVLVGDSQFVTNRNLEQEGGQPFEGLRENAEFWRWLTSYLESPDEPADWYKPPNPATQLKESQPAPPPPQPQPQPQQQPQPQSQPTDVFELHDPSGAEPAPFKPPLKGGQP